VVQKKWGPFVDLTGKSPVGPPLKAGSRGKI
jgi:hypothetical protein